MSRFFPIASLVFFFVIGLSVGILVDQLSSISCGDDEDQMIEGLLW
jgi:hypothetical protein